MTKEKEILKVIKSTSWQYKTAWERENAGRKPVSTYSMYNACVVPFDADAASLKASTNKSHEHFGKPVDEIKAIWQAKGVVGANRGNSIDDYITAKVLGRPFLLPENDAIFVNKAKGVDKFFDEISGRLGKLIDDEIWLFDYANGVNVRSDMMFYEETSNTIFVCEWKNITNFKTRNVKNQCHGPLTGYDNCDLIKVNLQVYTYKNILEQYFGSTYNVVPVIVNFVENDFNIIPTLLQSKYKELIASMASYAHKELQNSENK